MKGDVYREFGDPQGPRWQRVVGTVAFLIPLGLVLWALGGIVFGYSAG